MIDTTLTMTVGELVAADVRRGTLFARHGIDFCCGGSLSLAEACRARGLDSADLLRELDALADPPSADAPATWSLERVLDRIVNGHHVYVRTQAPVVVNALHRLMAATGDACPALREVTLVFERLADDLRHHMAKEELILFPGIRTLVHAQERGLRPPRPPFGTIRNPVHVMELEHDRAAADLGRIHELTARVQVPSEAEPAWRTCEAALDAFARDLQAHVHLENHVLFPAAAQLEEVLS